MPISTDILEKTKLNKKRLVDNHPNQKLIYETKADIKIICAGRNFGKSILMILECLRYISDNKESTAYLVFPTSEMGERIVWWDLIKIIKFLGWPAEISNHRHKVFFPFNNSRIYVASADKPERLDGTRIDFLGVDEYANMKKDTLWDEVLRPTLTPRSRCIITSTPKGYNHFYRLWMRGQDANQSRYKSWQFTTFDNTTEDGKKYSALLKADVKNIDPRLYRQEHEGSFEVSAGKCSPDFNRELHVHDLGLFDKKIRLSFDFNVNPMCSISFQIIPKSLLIEKFPVFANYKLQKELIYVHKEFRTPECNTQMQCSIIQSYFQEIKYDLMERSIELYGDATGKNRDTTAPMTADGKISSDWSIIKELFPNSYDKYKKANGSERDRVNALNGKIYNYNGEIGLIVNPTCEYLIQDLEQTSWNTTNKIDDSDKKAGHLYDGIGYAAVQEFPLIPPKKVGIISMQLNF